MRLIKTILVFAVITMQTGQFNPLFSSIRGSGDHVDQQRSVSPMPQQGMSQPVQTGQHFSHSPPQNASSAGQLSNFQPTTSAFGLDLTSEARNVARMLMQKFDLNRSGFLEGPELENMIREVHNILHLSAGVSNSDAQNLGQILDLNRDGRVCLNDVEAYVMKLLK